MRENHPETSSGSISSQITENESLSQKANWTPRHARKPCQGGKWCRYLQVPLPQRSQPRGTYSFYRAMKRLSSSSTMTTRAVRRRRRRQASFHLARSRSLASTNTKTRRMRCKQMILKLSDELYGMPDHIDPTGLSMLSLYLSL